MRFIVILASFVLATLAGMLLRGPQHLECRIISLTLHVMAAWMLVAAWGN